MTVDCDDIKRQIQDEFKKIKEAAAPNGNITDERVVKSKFNELVELAKKHCKTLYSIKWQPGGYVLIDQPYP